MGLFVCFYCGFFNLPILNKYFILGFLTGTVLC